MSQYFPKPYESFGVDINVKVVLFNYATKADLKYVAHVDVSNFALKSNLASLESEVDKLDIDKSLPVLVDFGNLSGVVKNAVVKKNLYDKLVAKVNNIDTTGFVLKTKYDTDTSELKKEINDFEKKIPDTSELVKKQI